MWLHNGKLSHDNPQLLMIGIPLITTYNTNISQNASDSDICKRRIYKVVSTTSARCLVFAHHQPNVEAWYKTKPKMVELSARSTNICLVAQHCIFHKIIAICMIKYSLSHQSWVSICPLTCRTVCDEELTRWCYQHDQTSSWQESQLFLLNHWLHCLVELNTVSGTLLYKFMTFIYNNMWLCLQHILNKHLILKDSNYS